MIRFALALLLVAIGLPFCLQILLDVIAERRHIPEEAIPMACGIAIGLLVIFMKRPNWLLHTIVH
ncbi:MAG: hypothetical protein H0W83_08685, partial [Planctomycetes bacterium]|nr:hypothetical protein [Planctomycetota bacterium]